MKCSITLTQRGTLSPGQNGVSLPRRARPAPRADLRARSQQAQTWSNPQGLTLKQLQPNLFVAERPFIWNGIDVGGKMAVVKLQDGSLWVHSPVHLDPFLKHELAALGEVKHIVSPNYEHVKHAQTWIDAYPGAISYACPGLLEKEVEIAFKETVGLNNSTPTGWPEQIQVTHLDFDVNPFTGKEFFNEVVFVDTVSKTLVITDAYWNYPEDVPFGTKLWKLGMDKVYKPFSENLMVKSPEAYKAAIGRVMSQDWDAILPCHGTYTERNGKAILSDFLRPM